MARWATRLGHEPGADLPPLRFILMLNMAESMQRIIVGRALTGGRPQSA